MPKFENNSKISIILPTHNRAGLIMETIQSILGQTYGNWELIIIDDGSEDNTEQVVKSVGDPRITFIKMGRIGINGQLKNVGMARAKGELLAFIDSDDLWAPGKLEKQALVLMQHKNARFSLTGGYNFKTPGVAEEYFYRQREGIFVGNVFEDIFRSKVAVLTPTLLFWKQCLDKIPGFREDKPFSDGDFILELARHFDAAILYEPLLFRRLHEGNDSDANWIRRCDEGLERIKFYRESKQLPPALARDAIFRLNIHAGEKHLRFKQYKVAIAKFIQAWQSKPYSLVPLKKTARAIVSAFTKQF